MDRSTNSVLHFGGVGSSPGSGERSLLGAPVLPTFAATIHLGGRPRRLPRPRASRSSDVMASSIRARSARSSDNTLLKSIFQMVFYNSSPGNNGLQHDYGPVATIPASNSVNVLADLQIRFALLSKGLRFVDLLRARTV